jgi:hypothetical protein
MKRAMRVPLTQRNDYQWRVPSGQCFRYDKNQYLSKG